MGTGTGGRGSGDGRRGWGDGGTGIGERVRGYGDGGTGTEGRGREYGDGGRGRWRRTRGRGREDGDMVRDENRNRFRDGDVVAWTEEGMGGREWGTGKLNDVSYLMM